MEAEKKGAIPESKKAKDSFGRESPQANGPGLVVFVLVGLVLGVAIKLFCLDILRVEGTSMEPAVADKSQVWVSKLAYGLVEPWGDRLLVQWREPRQDEVVLYFYNDRAVIKRCVAVAGDRLDFSTGFGYSLNVNEKNIPLTEAQYQKLKHNGQVPQGMILAVGDNYPDSVDSRDYGFVPVENVLGRIVTR